jgi:HAD superfamily hydrolase (TIGR01509 family)
MPGVSSSDRRELRDDPSVKLGVGCPLPEVECFLFDLDGTLVDSSPAHERAFLEALAALTAGEAEGFEYQQYRGLSTAAVFESLVEADGETLDALVKAKREAYLDQVQHGEVLLFPYAETLLREIQDSGRRSFLVTSASNRSALTILEKYELKAFFSDVVTSEDVCRPKPAPDMFELVLRRNQLTPSLCVTVEDAVSGVRASHAAGVDAVLVHGSQGAAGVRHYADLDAFARAIARTSTQHERVRGDD